MSEQATSILVVDDNKINRDLLTHRLTRKGYRVTEAEGGRQALTLIDGQPLDLVLLDIMMPEVDGREVLTTVRRSRLASELPIIMVTAKHDSSDVVDALALGANDYVVKPIDFPVLFARIETQLARKRAEDALHKLNQELEQRIEEQAEKLHKAETQLVGITKNLPGIIFRRVLKPDGTVDYPFISAGTQELTGFAPDDSAHCVRFAFEAVHPDDAERFNGAMERSTRDLTALDVEYRMVLGSGTVKWVHCGAQPRRLASGGVTWDGLLLDITDRKNLETQLLHSQKLESVGQLAAGIAHEINTPTQYVGDNTRFLQDAFGDLLRVLGTYARLLEAAQNQSVTPEMLGEVEAAVRDADLEYLGEEIPKAIEQALEGLQKISKIVGAMKEFSHPGGEEKETMDLNRVIETTITVARNEWKYVAEVVTDFAENLPALQCYPGELGQVFLNLIVNAAHAIADVVGDGSDGKGTITLRTRQVENTVEVCISDTGAGVPEPVRDKIFDPFFTTKEVGKGTGQGLAIARSVIVDKHGGALGLESESGRGATFVICLPLDQQPVGQRVAAR